MGKVYEALKMAGGSIHEGAPEPSVRGSSRVARGYVEPEPEAVNYMDYLLNGIPSPETPAAAEATLLAPIARPVIDVPRPAAVDIGNVDHRLVAFQGSDRPALEQYNRLGMALISGAAERRLKKILIGSAERGEGRTTVALNLACTLARARKRVLLIEADLAKPSIARMLGVDADPGLGDIFRWKNPGAALVSVRRIGFDLLPTRSRVGNSAEILSSRAFNLAIDLLEPHYDFILFDTPPLLEAADCNLLMRIADAMVLVITAGRLKTSQLAKAVGGLRPEDVFGVVLNRSRSASSLGWGIGRVAQGVSE